MPGKSAQKGKRRKEVERKTRKKNKNPTIIPASPAIIHGLILFLSLFFGALAGWGNENTSGGGILIALFYAFFTYFDVNLLPKRKGRSKEGNAREKRAEGKTKQTGQKPQKDYYAPQIIAGAAHPKHRLVKLHTEIPRYGESKFGKQGTQSGIFCAGGR